MRKMIAFLVFGSVFGIGTHQSSMDWSSYQIELKSSIPLKKNATIREEQFARQNALYEILEGHSGFLESIPIDGDHLLKDYLDENATFAEKYSYYLQTRSLNRVAYQKGFLNGQVILPIRNTGSLLAILPLPWDTFSYQPERKQLQSSAYENPADHHDYHRGRAAVRYTGLVVDAREQRLSPSLAPRIYAQDGRLIYGPEYLMRNTGIYRGVAGFAKSMNDPELQRRTGLKPLVTAALAVSGKHGTDVVISNQDARLLFDNAENLENLRKTKVIFLVDD